MTVKALKLVKKHLQGKHPQSSHAGNRGGGGSAADVVRNEGKLKVGTLLNLKDGTIMSVHRSNGFVITGMKTRKGMLGLDDSFLDLRTDDAELSGKSMDIYDFMDLARKGQVQSKLI